MKRKLLYLLMLALASASMQAQGTVFLKCGMCSSSYWGENSMGTSSKSGFVLGIGLDSQIGNSDFSVAPAVEIVSKGGRVKLNENEPVTIEANYLEVPIDFVYHYKTGKESCFDFMAGPYLSYGIGGKTAGVKTFRDHDGLERMDGGINLGLGYEYKMMLVNAGCDLGLRKVSGDSPKNLAFFLSFGIKI